MIKMKKILFFIHDLGQGGAEKVLVNLVNHMDRNKFNITVIALFGGGVNEQFLDKDIRFKTIFPFEIPGNSKLLKFLSPQLLHRICVKDNFDIEVSYLEGPSARIISGCKSNHTKLICWIHVEQHTLKRLAGSFRNLKEAKKCYGKFSRIICVSKDVQKDFMRLLGNNSNCQILYNTIESEKIIELSKEKVTQFGRRDEIKLVAVGSLKPSKGYERLLRTIRKLKNENFPIHLYILGIGPLEHKIEEYIENNNMKNTVTLLGYQTNPYKFVGKCDLFVCASYAEGFSTATTEALILGVPVCTVKVSGMTELLGENNEYGLVVENDEDSLYEGIKYLIKNPEILMKYRRKAKERGKRFFSEHTVTAVQDMLENVERKKENGN